LSFLATFGALAATTNNLSDVEIQGRNLAQQLLEQRPAENITNTGVLKIRNAYGEAYEVHIEFQILLTTNNWQSRYYSGWVTTKENHLLAFNLVITHDGCNSYELANVFLQSLSNNLTTISTTNLVGAQIMTPFANSDFWIADLGLEFFHWPEQKILKHDMKRGRSCEVLESTNPSPSANAYSRVVSWIDNETLGIVHAEAYDAKGRLLKEFDPKSFKKVNGQWELQEMEIRNDQTGSRTRLEFDWKKQD